MIKNEVSRFFEPQYILTRLCCEGIDAHEGVDVLMNVGIALAICFSILILIIVIVNLIHNKGCKRQR